MRRPVLSPDDREFLAGFKLRSERVWGDDPALADAAVGKVLLLGDIHNQRQVLDAALRTATDQNCDVLVQVGDFWLQDSTWELFSPQHAALMCSAVHAAIPVIVVDGNHEVWPSLTRFLERDDTITARADNRPLHLGGSLWWADRGSVWSWSSRQFGALGGAVSPDRYRPAAARHRWDQETTTPQDLDRLLDNAGGGLDVLICHDAPAGTTGLISGLRQPMPTGLQRQSDAVQDLLRTAVDATEPALVFHGHWHQPNRCRLNARSEIVGLDADGHSRSAAVLSISDLRVGYVDPFQRAHHRN